MTTTLLTTFAREEGTQYLREILSPPLTKIQPFLPYCEIDPKKFHDIHPKSPLNQPSHENPLNLSTSDAQFSFDKKRPQFPSENETRLRYITKEILSSILTHKDKLPHRLKKISKLIFDVIKSAEDERHLVLFRAFEGSETVSSSSGFQLSPQPPSFKDGKFDLSASLNASSIRKKKSIDNLIRPRSAYETVSPISFVPNPSEPMPNTANQQNTEPLKHEPKIYNRSRTTSNASTRSNSNVGGVGNIVKQFSRTFYTPRTSEVLDSSSPGSPGSIKNGVSRHVGVLNVPERVVGSFLFLRFIIPAITTPELLDIIDSPITPAMRRGLVLCSKILTSLCNDLEFGGKEQYLMCLNSFLEDNRPKFKEYLGFVVSEQDISKNESTDNIPTLLTEQSTDRSTESSTTKPPIKAFHSSMPCLSDPTTSTPRSGSNSQRESSSDKKFLKKSKSTDIFSRSKSKTLPRTAMTKIDNHDDFDIFRFLGKYVLEKLEVEVGLRNGEEEGLEKVFEEFKSLVKKLDGDGESTGKKKESTKLGKLGRFFHRSRSSDDLLSSQLQTRLDELAAAISSVECSNQASLSLESLLDIILALWVDCKTATNPTEHMNGFLSKYENIISRLQKLRINTLDFEMIKTLATGAVGKVCLVKGKLDNKIHAMKILKKTDLLTRREAAFFMEERNALVFARSSVWLTTLHAAFQDEENLYLVMEYASGGSLRNLINSRDDPMPESDTKFYMAQMLMALEELHSFNYIHRDVKPENWLIDASGHIKLADFGSCMQVGAMQKITSNETVGTPDYISPEILRAHEGNVSYGKECDWWSLGIILYELLFDEVPFYSESLAATYSKIMDHEKHFAFPEECQASAEAMDLIRRLICKKEVRLGLNGTDEIKNHIWLKEMDFANIRNQKPPFVPELAGPDDTRYFEDEESEMKKVTKKALQKTKEYAGQNLPFVGYTYIQFATPTVSWKVIDKSAGNSANSDSGGVNVSGKELESLNLRVLEDSKKLAEVTENAKSLKIQLEKAIQTSKDSETNAKKFEVEVQKLKGEVREAKSLRDQEEQEKMELENKVSKMKRTFEEETKKIRSQMMESQDTYEKLEKQNSELQAELTKEREFAANNSSTVSHLTQRVSQLEANIQANKKKEEELLRDLSASQTKTESLAEKLLAETTKRAQLQIERTQISQSLQTNITEFELLKKAVDQEKLHSEKVSLENVKLQREKAILEVERDNLSKQVATMKQEYEMQVGLLMNVQSSFEKEKSGIKAAEADNESLKIQLQNSNTKRTQLTEELEKVTKNLAVKELEVLDLQKKLQVELKTNSGLSQKCAGLETNQSLANERIVKLEEDNNSLQHTNASLQSKVEISQNSISSASQTISDLQGKFDAAIEDAAKQKTEISNLQTKVAKINEKNQLLSQNLIATEQKVTDERKAKVAAVDELQSAHIQISELKSEVERLQTRVTVLKEEQNSSAKLKDETITHLTETASSLENRLNSEIKLNENLEKDHASLLNQKIEIDTKMQSMITQNTELEKKIATLKTDSQNLQQRIHDQEKNSSTLQEKLYEVESQLERIRQESLDEKKSLGTKSMDNLKTDPKPALSERGTIKSKIKVFFRNKGSDGPQPLQFIQTQQLSSPVGVPPNSNQRSITRIFESADEDLGTHSRRISNESSSMSLLSGQTKLSDFPEFNPSEGLSGPLKIPKGAKLKKGWKYQYAKVQEHTLYVYETHRDAIEGLISRATLSVDLKSDIFVVKSVNQNELIHASGKDIDSIFKIQAGTRRKRTSTTQAGSPISIQEIQKKIMKLTADITLEEQMHAAAEKMLSVATDHNKESVLRQIAVSGQRLQNMKLELEKAQALLQNSPALSPNQAMTQDEKYNAILEMEILNTKKMLEDMIKKEGGTKEHAEKFVLRREKTLSRSGSTPPVSPFPVQAVADELTQYDKNIVKMKEDLAVLEGSDQAKIKHILKKYSDVNGHQFKSRSYYAPTDCAVCHEPLWGTNSGQGHGLECNRCRVVTHKHCKNLVDLSCEDYEYIQNITPMYFMASDIGDKHRWIGGLEYFRRESSQATERNLNSTITSPNSITQSQRSTFPT